MNEERDEAARDFAHALYLTAQPVPVTMEKRAELSPRLQGVAEMIPEGARLADVGTDHAYLPAWLLQNGRIPSAIASDVREGPLSRARATAGPAAALSGCPSACATASLGSAPEEVDALVIAGMGWGDYR